MRITILSLALALTACGQASTMKSSAGSEMPPISEAPDELFGAPNEKAYNLSPDAEIHMINILQTRPALSPAQVINGVFIPSVHAPGTPQVTILPGTTKIVLSLRSYEANTWTIKGAVERVDRVLLTGYKAQYVKGIDPARVATSTNAQKNEKFCKIRSYFAELHEVPAHAMAACLQDRFGGKVASMQALHTYDKFKIGDGLNLPPPLIAETLRHDWIYVDGGIELWENSGGGSNLLSVQRFSHDYKPASFKVKTAHVTTDDSDLRGWDRRVEFSSGATGVSLGMQSLKKPVGEVHEGDEYFKVLISDAGPAWIISPEVEGVIHD